MNTIYSSKWRFTHVGVNVTSNYSVPEIWTLEPVYDTIVPYLEKLAWICNWYDDVDGLLDDDEENIQTVITNLENCIKEL